MIRMKELGNKYFIINQVETKHNKHVFGEVNKSMHCLLVCICSENH